jgi:hypothetical protein
VGGGHQIVNYVNVMSSQIHEARVGGRKVKSISQLPNLIATIVQPLVDCLDWNGLTGYRRIVRLWVVNIK